MFQNKDNFNEPNVNKSKCVTVCTQTQTTTDEELNKLRNLNKH